MYPEPVRRRALELLASGRSVADVARSTGISRNALTRWRKNGINPARPTLCFRCNLEASVDAPTYSYLLGLYLGDGSLTAYGSRGVMLLRIACADAWPGLIDACEAASAILGTKTRRIQQQGCTSVATYSKHWPCLFPQHGPGRKHERPIVLESWQEQVVNGWPDDFLRGLFHSDGCRFTNPVVRHFKSGTKRYEYPRYMFTNESADIRKLCTDTLDKLWIPWRYSRANTISVARRDAVAALDQFVGPKY
jgi:transcriptional regulator with XRE-family HTH domain